MFTTLSTPATIQTTIQKTIQTRRRRRPASALASDENASEQNKRQQQRMMRTDDDDDETESCNGEAWGANGDRQTFSAEGTGASSGIPTVSLLTTANAFAASCIQSHKILWTTTLTTPYTVTDESVFELKMKTTDSVSIDFSSSDGDNDIIKMGADPVKLFLTVTG